MKGSSPDWAQAPPCSRESAGVQHEAITIEIAERRRQAVAATRRAYKNSGSVVVCTIGPAARRFYMMARRMAILSCLVAIGSILVGEPAFAALSRAMQLRDTDNDGTVDLEEAPRSRPPRCPTNSTVTTTGPSTDASWEAA